MSQPLTGKSIMLAVQEMLESLPEGSALNGDVVMVIPPEIEQHCVDKYGMYAAEMAKMMLRMRGLI